MLDKQYSRVIRTEIFPMPYLMLNALVLSLMTPGRSFCYAIRAEMRAAPSVPL